ncbi:MAG: hypothetical protein CL609_08145 [Anaerolineaceae bacterium]|nr:hypothetical protein [Anaerolineaceae bacterium]
MTRLLLIKHAMPEIDLAVSANAWQLSTDGKRSCVRLADQLNAFHLDEIISSDEIKAIQTAQITAGLLGLTHRVYPGLHEHDRTGEPYFSSKQAFQDKVQALFNTPDQLVYGNETANQAFIRFDQSIKHLISTAAPQKDVAVVTHGTVISLLVSHYQPLDGFLLWQDLGLPSIVVLSLPDYAVLDVIKKLD